MLICTNPPPRLHYKTLCNTITIIIMNIRITWLHSDMLQKFWKQTIARDASLCYVIITLFYITLTLQIMLLLNVIYPDISIIFLSPRGMDYSVYARSQSEPALQYNTGSDWLSPYTEWSQQGFQMQCSKEWCFYDSVILKQCKSLMPDSKTHGHCALVS